MTQQVLTQGQRTEDFTQAQIDTMFNDIVTEKRGLDFDTTGCEIDYDFIDACSLTYEC